METETIKNCLTTLQNEANKLYEELGATDEIIDLQISINKIRNKYNIPDETKMTTSNPNFVQ